MNDKQLIQHIGKTIRAMRKNKGVTLPDLASKAKCSQGNLSKIENGNGNVSVITLNKLAKALSVNVGEMV